MRRSSAAGTVPGDQGGEQRWKEAPRSLRAQLIATTGALCYLAGAAAVMSSELVEVGGGAAGQALAAMVALQLALGYAVGRRWALLLCIAPALLALLPGLLPHAPDVPGYGALFSVAWLLVGWPVAGAITLAGVAGRRATSRRGERAP